jgi:hypothetical protein
MLDPAEGMLGDPFSLDLVRRELGIQCTIGRFDVGLVGIVNTVTTLLGLGIGEGRIFTRGRVAIVADKIHGFVIAEQDHDLAALAPGFLLQLLKIADNLERVRPAVRNVAHLDQGRVSTSPMVPGIDEPRSAGNSEPCVIVAVKIADSDDALLGSPKCGGGNDPGEEEREHGKASHQS